MNKTFQIGAALGAAALVVAGGSAFTASNTVPETAAMGQGTTAVSGITVTETDYTYSDMSDTTGNLPTTLLSVKYTFSEDENQINATDADATLMNVNGTDILAVQNCAITEKVDETLGFVTCTIVGGWDLADVEGLALTVTAPDAP